MPRFGKSSRHKGAPTAIQAGASSGGSDPLRMKALKRAQVAPHYHPESLRSQPLGLLNFAKGTRRNLHSFFFP